MAFDDRHSNRHGSEESSGFGGGIRRYFSSRTGFFSWSLPLFTVPARVPLAGGVRVRIHLIYILIVLGELLGSGQQSAAGFGLTLAMMATLFLLVLLHEFGHVIACRAVGGEAEEILMWPLGGLAYCSPPRRWKPALITTLAGPGVNAALVPVFVAALLLSGSGWKDCIFNPFAPTYEFRGYAHAWLWSAHYMNLVLLGFNMLVPMFPMDCGRVVQEILWARIGYRRSMVIAVNLGLGVAIVMGVLAIPTGQMRLVSLALFGGLTCYAERKRLQMMEDEPAWAWDTDRGFGGFSDENADRLVSRQKKAQQQAEKERSAAMARQEQVNAILDKIAAHGLHSLTRREKKILKDATDRQRAGGERGH